MIPYRWIPDDTQSGRPSSRVSGDTLSPNPVKVDEHAATSGVPIGSTRDVHDVWSTEITEGCWSEAARRHLGCPCRYRTEFSSVVCFPSQLSMDEVHHDDEQATAYWHTRIQNRRKALGCEKAVRFRMILRSKLHN
jgi:hypothetical protein